MLACVSAGSVHTEGMSRFYPGSRCGTAVAVGPRRVTAPWKCSKRIAVIGEGTAANRSTAVSISVSERPRVKLDEQVVGREAVLRHQPAEAAAEGVAGEARRGHGAAG